MCEGEREKGEKKKKKKRRTPCIKDQGALSCLILALVVVCFPSSSHPPFPDSMRPPNPSRVAPNTVCAPNSAFAEKNEIGRFCGALEAKDIFFFLPPFLSLRILGSLKATGLQLCPNDDNT